VGGCRFLEVFSGPLHNRFPGLSKPRLTFLSSQAEALLMIPTTASFTGMWQLAHATPTSECLLSCQSRMALPVMPLSI